MTRSTKRGCVSCPSLWSRVLLPQKKTASSGGTVWPPQRAFKGDALLWHHIQDISFFLKKNNNKKFVSAQMGKSVANKRREDWINIHKWHTGKVRGSLGKEMRKSHWNWWPPAKQAQLSGKNCQVLFHTYTTNLCFEQLSDSPLQSTPGRKLFWLKFGRSRWHSPAASNFALVGITAVLGLLTVCVQWGTGLGREQTSPRWCLTAS